MVKPFALMLFPVVLCMIVGIIYASYADYSLACGTNFACTNSGANTWQLRFFPPGSPIERLVGGDIGGFFTYGLYSTGWTGTGNIIADTLLGLIFFILPFVLIIASFGLAGSVTAATFGFSFEIKDQGIRLMQVLSTAWMLWQLTNWFMPSSAWDSLFNIGGGYGGIGPTGVFFIGGSIISVMLRTLIPLCIGLGGIWQVLEFGGGGD